MQQPTRPPNSPELGQRHEEKHQGRTYVWKFSARGWEADGIREAYRPLDGSRHRK